MTIILGAGIAGLWLHNRLNQLGHHSLLIDINPIGSAQTMSAQGIIHGGIKYSLKGALSDSANAIAAMPQVWRDCITGQGELDLSATQVLAEHQLMWSEGSLASKVTGFFSSQAVRGKMEALSKKDYPKLFSHANFKGALYQLNEPVLDTHSLVKNLAQPFQHRILQVPDYQFAFNDLQQVCGIQLSDGSVIKADQLVLTAGEGNEALLEQLNITSPKMQRRPLKMVLMKSPDLPMVYAHCVGTSSKPLVTITSHHHGDGDIVWYLGGEIAEKGIDKTDDKLIHDTKAMLKRVLPWFDLTQGQKIQWAVHSVNRAEPLQEGLLRPDTAFVESHNNIHIAWPTKLALAPVLAKKVIDAMNLHQPVSNQSITDYKQLAERFPAQIAKPLWNRVFP